MTSEQHLAKAAEFLSVAESGDAERSAYEHAALEIEAAMQADPTLTHRGVGKQLGKSHTYVGNLLRSLERTRSSGGPFNVDWQSGSNRRIEVTAKVLERPEAFAEMIARATPDVRQKIIEAVTDPSTKAGRLIAQEVLTADANQRRKHREQTAQAKDDGAPPLPARMAAMVERMSEWANALAAITNDDLDELPPGTGRDLVADRARYLGTEAFRWVDTLTPAKPGLRVLEGSKAI